MPDFYTFKWLGFSGQGHDRKRLMLGAGLQRLTTAL